MASPHQFGCGARSQAGRDSAIQCSRRSGARKSRAPYPHRWSTPVRARRESARSRAPAMPISTRCSAQNGEAGAVVGGGAPVRMGVILRLIQHIIVRRNPDWRRTQNGPDTARPSRSTLITIYTNRVTRFALSPALLIAALLAGGSARAAVPFMPLREIHAGLHGTGRTVFSGDKVEEFQVEILGVLENTGPRQSLILARLSGGPAGTYRRDAGHERESSVYRRQTGRRRGDGVPVRERPHRGHSADRGNAEGGFAVCWAVPLSRSARRLRATWGLLFWPAPSRRGRRPDSAIRA